MKLSGEFKITDWQESVNTEFSDRSKLSTAIVTQTYSGSIEGTSTVHYLLSYNSEGEAQFTGFEVIEGQLNNQLSRITLKHNGYFTNGIATSQFEVTGATTHPNLKGQKGEFKSSTNGMASYCMGKSQ